MQEVAAAVVVLMEGATPLTMESLRAYLEVKGLAKPYRPKQLHVMNEIPRTPSGKIQKFLIRKQLTELSTVEGAK
ncbi:AMP-binding enzyme [Neomicrococcus lactis]